MNTIQSGQHSGVALARAAAPPMARAHSRAGARILCTTLLLVAVGLFACASPTGRSQQSFSTPQEAAHAFLDALKRNDASSLTRIFGIENQKRIASADWNANPQARDRITRAANDIYAIRDISSSEAQLVLGVDREPFPIPIMKDAKGWYFDPARAL